MDTKSVEVMRNWRRRMIFTKHRNHYMRKRTFIENLAIMASSVFLWIKKVNNCCRQVEDRNFSSTVSRHVTKSYIKMFNSHKSTFCFVSSSMHKNNSRRVDSRCSLALSITHSSFLRRQEEISWRPVKVVLRLVQVK